MWLKLVQYFVNSRIIVVGLTINGTAVFGSAIPSVTSVGPVKPYFEYFTVVGHQFSQLFMEVIYVFRCAVIGLVPVPWREVNSELDAIFLTSGSQLADDVPFSVFIRSVADAILRQLGGPQAETVMMLGGEGWHAHRIP